MKTLCLAAIAAGLAATSAHAAPLRSCGPHDTTTAADPIYQETLAHRQFEPAPITYARAVKDRTYGFALTLLIDETGHPICIADQSTAFSQDKKITPERKAYLSSVTDWRYQPFTVDGKPVRVRVHQYVAEQVLPKTHVATSPGDIAATSVTLDRGGCFGDCPSYRVTVHGDGRVEYEGFGFVDVRGRHSYSIPPAEAAALIERLRGRDLWSMDDGYIASITDSASYALVIDIAGQRKVITDYVGNMIGMPVAISDSEDDIDKVAGADMLIHLSSDGVKVLKDEGFDFASQDGADMLARAAAGDSSSDDALLALVELGAPLAGGTVDRFGPSDHRPVLSQVLLHRHVAVVEPLIARGALLTDGKPDQAKIDQAFDDAITGGRLAPVQRLWQVAGDTPHPSLIYTSVDRHDDDEAKPPVQAPVTLLLKRDYDDKAWEGPDIAKWLIAQGCDFRAHRADGTTLLHIAAEANSPELVRYLLDLGMDPSTLGEYDLMALDGTDNEDVALALLDGGADLSKHEGGIKDLRRYATNMGWNRVLAWLDAHPDAGR